MNAKTIAALAGFLALGLSPSFIDWQTEPGKRKQIVGYYAVALLLVWYGALSGR